MHWNGHRKEASGAEIETTNNRMELTAAIEALSLLKQPCQVHRLRTKTCGSNSMPWWRVTTLSGLGSKATAVTQKMNASMTWPERRPSRSVDPTRFDKK
jgi:hypothetical protein